MKRHRNRRQKAVQKLNLVALMDIFTILVFFLMVNSSDVQIKETHESVSLPESTTTELPEDTLKLYITQDYMFFENDSRQIALSNFSNETGTYPALVEALTSIATAQGELPESREEAGRPITIMGDQDTSYTTIQQVLASCAKTSYRDVSLAVIYQEEQQEASSAQLQTRPGSSTQSVDALAATNTTRSISNR